MQYTYIQMRSIHKSKAIPHHYLSHISGHACGLPAGGGPKNLSVLCPAFVAIMGPGYVKIALENGHL